MDGYGLKRILRRPWLSLVSFFVCGALCVLLCILLLYRDRQEARLADIKQNYEVLAVVTDSRGTRSDDLNISRRYIDFLQDEQDGLGAYIRDLRLTKAFSAWSPLGTGKAIGVSNEYTADALNPKAGGVWYAEVEDFFASEERICLVAASKYEAFNGQEIVLELTDSYTIENGTGEFPFRVVGWYGGDSSDVYMPYGTAQIIAGRLADTRSADSVRFSVKDKEEIDEMLAAAEKVFRKIDPSSGSEGFFALTVYDKQYKATIASMEQNIRRTSYLLPLIGILGLGAGFLLGLLGTRGEIRTYALMRTLGMSGFRLFCTVMFEQILLPLLAAGIVALIFRRPLPALVFFGCHLVGCALAILRPVSAPPTRLLRDQE